MDRGAYATLPDTGARAPCFDPAAGFALAPCGLPRSELDPRRRVIALCAVPLVLWLLRCQAAAARVGLDRPRFSHHPRSPPAARGFSFLGHAMHQTNNTHVIATQRLMSPDELKAGIPISERAADFVYTARERIRAVIHGRDPRLLVIAGPCSIHDPAAARDYAARLAELAQRHRAGSGHMGRRQLQRRLGCRRSRCLDHGRQLDRRYRGGRRARAVLDRPAGRRSLAARTGTTSVTGPVV